MTEVGCKECHYPCADNSVELPTQGMIIGRIFTMECVCNSTVYASHYSDFAISEIA